MNPRRIALALLVALLLSGSVTFFLANKLRSHNRSRPQSMQLVATSHPVLAGEILKPENLTLIDWPSSVPLPGAFSKIGDVQGRAALYPMTNGQPVLDRYLAAQGSGIGLTAKIPEGMRATALRSNEVVGVAGFLFPGSHVDVLVTYRSEQSPSPLTQIAVQDAEVLTAGQKIEPDPQGKPETVSVVTLLLSPQDAQKVVLAASQGTIQFVLRNGSDHDQILSRPVGLAALAGMPPAAGNPVPRPSSLNPTPRTPYAVETIAGDKRLLTNF